MRLPHVLWLGLCAAMLVVPGVKASTITDFLDRIGGCRRPLHESFSREVSPYTPKPYGKALADWTDQDLTEFRAYFVGCAQQRPDWGSMGAFNRNDAIRVIDTALQELRYRVRDGHAIADKQRADLAYQAEQSSRVQAQQRSEADAAARQAQAQQEGQAKRQEQTAELRRKVKPLTDELKAFMKEIETLPHDESLRRIDGYVARIRAQNKQLADQPAAVAALEKTAQNLTGLRDQFIKNDTQKRDSQKSAPSATNLDSGPYASFEWLGQQLLSAGMNPLRRKEFHRSLSRGIDFNVAISRIEASPNGWLLQLSGRPGSSGRPDQGLFCRVASDDAASLAILRSVTPPYAIVHVEAPGADEFLLELEPVIIRIVFSSCQVTPANDGTPRSRKPANVPTNGSGSAKADVPPVVPSPPDLRCTWHPPRREGEQVMAHRLREAWALPEALAGDPSLNLTFAVTLNFDGQVTEPSKLLNSDSKQATPEQMQQAVDAAHRAISTTMPFPELGQFAGGTMQVDMTPCD